MDVVESRTFSVKSCNISYMSYSLNSLKGGLYKGLDRGTTIGLITGDTRTLDNGSYGKP